MSLNPIFSVVFIFLVLSLFISIPLYFLVKASKRDEKIKENAEIFFSKIFLGVALFMLLGGLIFGLIGAFLFN